jgi:uncharacterized protein YnzC (UPF0291/DUF896 family)
MWFIDWEQNEDGEWHRERRDEFGMTAEAWEEQYQMQREYLDELKEQRECFDELENEDGP